ncbi:MAG: TIM barrel protein [Patescibacteria group bacterium]
MSDSTFYELNIPPLAQRQKIYEHLIIPILTPGIVGGNLSLTSAFVTEAQKKYKEKGIARAKIELGLGTDLFRRREPLEEYARLFKGKVHSVHLPIAAHEWGSSLEDRLIKLVTHPPAVFIPAEYKTPAAAQQGRLTVGLAAAQAVDAKLIVLHASELAFHLAAHVGLERTFADIMEKIIAVRDAIAPYVIICMEHQGHQMNGIPRENYPYVYDPLALADALSPWQNRHIGMTFDFQHYRINTHGGSTPSTILRQIFHRHPRVIKHVHINRSPIPHLDQHKSIADADDETWKSEMSAFLLCLAEMNYEGAILPEVNPPGTLFRYVRILLRRKNRVLLHIPFTSREFTAEIVMLTRLVDAYRTFLDVPQIMMSQ